MISRYFISFNLAALITISLFFAMNLLISNGETVLVEKENTVPIIFIKPREVEETKTRERMPEEPIVELIPEVNIPLVPGDTTNVIPTGGEIVIVDPVVTHKKNPTGFDIEGGHTPIVRVAPQYPTNMASKGIEGYVKVSFTITVNGSVKDATVIESSHRGFERNALRAVEKFKYKPKVVDGVAVPVTGMTTTLEFKLEK
ncbi:energy transducer TonB [Pseudemcibacter aquimaris]|uniref:energy transducer TonB n=1 Tax=Pseudemcibacter aquimaris TaxID=2857064 RepID=UPI0020131A8F|nr:energy transducer TonB [Pseudemcibacter aquimaris]MCC3862286.1 energy transducer TonB [Pseudemcibacter aquimaris]WDU59036.1 energy transducer TonB [Pseudemcibacter aquimaris]